MASKALGLPPTRQSLVVVNGRLDRNAYSERQAEAKKEPAKVNLELGSDNDHGIATHELCFAMIHQGNRLHFNEPEIAVFSSFNGFKKYNKMKDHQQVRFIGVSQTTIAKPFEGNGHLSMSVAGVVRIFHTGKIPFEIGDKVVWSIPQKKEDQTSVKDISPSKIYPVLKPLNMLSSQVLKHELKTENPTWLSEFEKVVEWTLEKIREEESRVIGIALSRAKAGEAFDVLLRYN